MSDSLLQVNSEDQQNLQMIDEVPPAEEPADMEEFIRQQELPLDIIASDIIEDAKIPEEASRVSNDGVADSYQLEEFDEYTKSLSWKFIN